MTSPVVFLKMLGFCLKTLGEEKERRKHRRKDLGCGFFAFLGAIVKKGHGNNGAIVKKRLENSGAIVKKRSEKSGAIVKMLEAMTLMGRTRYIYKIDKRTGPCLFPPAPTVGASSVRPSKGRSGRVRSRFFGYF